MRTKTGTERVLNNMRALASRGRLRRIVGVGVLAGILAATMASGCSRAIWYVAPEFGEKKAAKDNKPILYYFKAWDSTQHRNMLKNVLHDPRVDRELKKTINIELEFGFFDEESGRFNVRKPQVCVFAAPDGTRLTPNYSVNPVPTPEAFLIWLKDAMRKAPQLSPPASADTTKATPDATPTETAKPDADEKPAAPPQKME